MPLHFPCVLRALCGKILPLCGGGVNLQFAICTLQFEIIKRGRHKTCPYNLFRAPSCLSCHRGEIPVRWAGNSTLKTQHLTLCGDGGLCGKTGPTRFELAIFGLTGRRVNQATPRPRKKIKYQKSKIKNYANPTGFNRGYLTISCNRG